MAKRAAEQLQQELREGQHSQLGQDFESPGGGKMLGVLVVRGPHTRLAFIRAGSGMLGGTWRPDGFAPPLFDDEVRGEFWPAGQIALDEVANEITALETGEEAQALEEQRLEVVRRHQEAECALRREHKARKAARALRRALPGQTKEELSNLGHQSQDDRRDGKALRALHKAELEAHKQDDLGLRSRIAALKTRRTATSNALLAKIQDGYHIRDATGAACSLSSLYAAEAPGGSGDCAGPKLLDYAYQHGLTPIAFAEFWWGAPPPGGGRHSGQFYPACRGKCGPLLAFMLQGLQHDAAPLFGSEVPQKSPPETIYEDAHIFAVNKPEPLLSVPGATSELRDSALTRLRDAWDATGKPLHVHRLDRDTSGVLLLAKTREAHKAMQALFAERHIEKRYVAWLDGQVTRDRGSISLSLRVDLEDRPRQIVDPINGKEATTEYEVLERRNDRTKVAFYPRTGRTHQLRVHAAHVQGLAAPIIGDRLYGKPASRLYLHAESLRFAHPVSGEPVCLECLVDDDFDDSANRAIL
ncbi:MAG: RluA family pseudouridine synthase [Myxococcales bacterium]|nr:RluA family pseudouridine synthase [Myxococcales bacterium]